MKRSKGWGRIGRRQFIRASSTGVLAAGAGGLVGCDGNPMPSDGGQPDGGGTRELRILTWQNFVPQFDSEFLDPFAARWGMDNGVDVTVDHVPVTMLAAMLQSQIDAGEGHDLVEVVSAPGNFEPFVEDLTDVNMAAEAMYGPQSPICRASSFNPVTNKYFGFCHAWLPDPGVYRRSMWEMVGMPDGPRTYDELLSAGEMIRTTQGVPLGIGIAPEIDSNMAMRAVLWSYGGSVQDASRNVVINSPQTIAALDYVRELYMRVLPPDVTMWGPANNNDAFIGGTASYILNSISAYRTSQTTATAVADDTAFVPALAGPSAALVGPHGVIVYVIPSHARNKQAAKDFLLAMIGSYSDAVFASRMYYFPAFPQTTPQLTEPMGWLDSDPFGSMPASKLSVLKTAEDWSVPLGHPGSANPAVGEIFAMGIVPRMFAAAATGMMTSAEAAQWGEDQITPIFERWRSMGLV